MAHRWSRADQRLLVDMALRIASHELTPEQAASKLAEAFTQLNPANPLTDSAAAYALSVALGALEGETYGTSQDLRDEIASRGKIVPPARIVFESREARSIELTIDACLRFRPEQLDERKGVFEFANLEAPAARFFKGADLAIEGRYDGDGEVRPNMEVRRRVEARRRNGHLTRRWQCTEPLATH